MSWRVLLFVFLTACCGEGESCDPEADDGCRTDNGGITDVDAAPEETPISSLRLDAPEPLLCLHDGRRLFVRGIQIAP